MRFYGRMHATPYLYRWLKKGRRKKKPDHILCTRFLSMHDSFFCVCSLKEKALYCSTARLTERCQRHYIFRTTGRAVVSPRTVCTVLYVHPYRACVHAICDACRQCSARSW